MQGYLFMFFSLFRQIEETKRDHVARFESEQITILKNWAAELASLKQSSPHLRWRSQSLHSFAASLAIATLPLPHSLPIWRGM